jgi:hypothetical protein
MTLRRAESLDGGRLGWQILGSRPSHSLPSIVRLAQEKATFHHIRLAEERPVLGGVDAIDPVIYKWNGIAYRLKISTPRNGASRVLG